MALRAITAESEPTEDFFGTTRNNLSLFLLRRGWRYRMAELENHLISPVDVLTLPLPSRLRALYPFLRVPLWCRRRMKMSRSDLN